MAKQEEMLGVKFDNNKLEPSIDSDHSMYYIPFYKTDEYFDIYEKAKNIEWLDKTCNHNEIIKLLNEAKCALMPTRTDAQGLMACEMATFGIPLITSDIPVCHEIFDEFKNVRIY